MTDLENYRALPPAEKERLGFAKYQEELRQGTHNKDCWLWGARHYRCALERIGNLEHKLKGQT
ncbi:MAG: hypothetical protein LBV29_03025 [Azoarcus sp.]|jgi:hypothetical protein|nr:hypothetical protein [Azoarcus sp.]